MLVSVVRVIRAWWSALAKRCGLAFQDGDRAQLREALKPLVLRPEPPRIRQVYAEPDGREKISHVFKVMRFAKRKAS